MSTTEATPASDTTRGGLQVRLEDMCRSFGPVRALDGLSLEIAPGELVALLGPSGCGKTTALRALAGLDRLDSGRIVVGGADITTVSANRRDMGMVFQAYSLFPNMTARDNVGYGLLMRRVATAERRRTADELLELVRLGTQADRYPHQLSGGQQQRVALARALAIKPKVLLLDEPLSALDAKVRVQLRDEIRRIQLEFGTTTLFVTHDQEEALALADRVGVMRAGRLEQLTSPTELYARPRTAFVAEFVGLTNRIAGTAESESVQVLGTRVPLLPGSAQTGPVTALVRPESVRIAAHPNGDAHVLATGFLGALCRVQVQLAGGDVVLAQVSAADATDLAPGRPVRVEVAPTPVFASPA
jgi:putative spermidine/putrescine transport system ATP-binding protein